ncbi:MAG: VWA domain-containing protein [Pseudomonadota bacterium]
MTDAVSSPITDRVAGFVGHLRLNGFALGPAESELALNVLDAVGAPDADGDRRALKTALCADHDQWQRFDDLFEAYWHARGRVRERLVERDDIRPAKSAVASLWDRSLGRAEADDADQRASTSEAVDEPEGDGGHGRLVASRQSTMFRRDLREIAERDEIAEAERLAYRLASAIRINRSRRRRAAPRGEPIDLRRTLRASLARGGEPVDLYRRRRPVRPVRVVLLLDVSGSMQAYSRYFLQFARGLVGGWYEAEAFIFHTRLIKVSDALRERDPLRAMARLSLMTQGIGGGTRIGDSLRVFKDRHAASALNSRSVVMILSDGYDTGAPEVIERELTRLKKKARRIVWLNPLAGWKGYEPVARAMTAAMPLLDGFAPVTTLEDLARIEPMLERL